MATFSIVFLLFKIYILTRLSASCACEDYIYTVNKGLILMSSANSRYVGCLQLLSLILILSVIFFSVKYFIVNNVFIPGKVKNGSVISISFADSNIKAVSADSASKVMVVAQVHDLSGTALRNVPVRFSVKSQYGIIVPVCSKTNEFGECLAYFVPKNCLKSGASQEKASLTASLNENTASASIELNIVPAPVVLIHGYQSNGSAFANMSRFLSSNNITCIIFEYDSTEGIKKAALSLNSFLLTQKQELLQKGLLVNRFDIIAHSLGGVVSRYYSSSDYYSKNNNVRKLILLGVPNHGSIMASFAENYFKDISIKDLSPQSSIFTKQLPSMINNGLNNKLEVGNIVVENDEVVSMESSGLEEWGIQSEIFNIGKNSLINNIFSDVGDESLYQNSNHQAILNNSAIFNKIFAMLHQQLPNPKTLR